MSTDVTTGRSTAEGLAGPADPAFPVLHGRPALGWVNDPNGLAHVDGVWHVFFQHNPAAPVHGDICWGHVSSADLITWRTEPLALRPAPGGPDAVGCWTGSVVLDGPDRVPTAVYTGVGADGPEHAVTLLATSTDGLRTWTREPAPVAVPAPREGVREVRDPFLFTHGGHRWAVQGAGHPQGRGRLLLWRCDDLRTWEPAGELLTADDPLAARWAPANTWECPNLVPFGDRWLLVVSLWHWRDGTHALDGVSWLLGDLEPAGAGLRFVPADGGALDGGSTFYAPQLLATDDGRVLVWGWSREDERDPADVEASGWSGVLTFPRDLRPTPDGPAVEPAPELLGLRRAALAGTVRTERSFEVEADGPVELLLTGRRGTARTVVTAGREGTARILVDGSLVEVFEAGRATTLRAYPAPGAVWHVRGQARCYLLGEPPARPVG
ncbi:glycoside hydrolase family 32 protein [Kineococcus rhizosphaerae]|uniref:beta-fructofuranosidase n=1 Tax=Kineococcus rhizosphaerae TaxID=559628 RepID=A0A2T0R7Y5_9ACTN|nr:glycoside hydrolase family 32 protein [Kineococcus rhizosphaerae]PRY17250.1 beta-fructofuranosidase [Kineococcus rhizosphaerae]